MSLEVRKLLPQMKNYCAGINLASVRETTGVKKLTANLVARLILTVAWIVTVLAAFAWLIVYTETPGPVGPMRDASIPPPCYQCMWLFLHPHCPCTNASLKELVWILDRTPEDVRCEIFFVRPRGVPADWHESSLWHKARAMARIDVRIDESGLMARRYGAKTSGHLILFDSRGQARFRGGITMRRGHEGDNAGRRLLLARLQSTTPEPDSHPVYGCPLLSHCDECSKEDES